MQVLKGLKWFNSTNCQCESGETLTCCKSLGDGRSVLFSVSFVRLALLRYSRVAFSAGMMYRNGILINTATVAADIATYFSNGITLHRIQRRYLGRKWIASPETPENNLVKYFICWVGSLLLNVVADADDRRRKFPVLVDLLFDYFLEINIISCSGRYEQAILMICVICLKKHSNSLQAVFF